MTQMDVEYLTDNLWGPVYAVCAAALMICLLILTLRAERGSVPAEKRNRRDLILGIAGVLLLSLCFAVGMILTGRGNDTGEWARDMFLEYYRIAGPALAGLLLILCFASLCTAASPKLQKGLFPRFRVWVNPVCSALFLLLTPFYAALTVNPHVPIHILILLSGLGAALVFRLLLPLEYRAERKKSSVNPEKGFSR